MDSPLSTPNPTWKKQHRPQEKKRKDPSLHDATSHYLLGNSIPKIGCHNSFAWTNSPSQEHPTEFKHHFLGTLTSTPKSLLMEPCCAVINKHLMPITSSKCALTQGPKSQCFRESLANFHQKVKLVGFQFAAMNK